VQHPGSCKDQGAETLLEAQDAADARAQVVLELVDPGPSAETLSRALGSGARAQVVLELVEPGPSAETLPIALGSGARAQVVLELVELREVDTARAMLRQTAVFAGMKQEEPDRFLRLEHLCGRAYFDVRRGAGLRGRCAQAVRLV